MNEWWDEDAYVCNTACIDDICRNAGRCMWPPTSDETGTEGGGGHE